MNTRHCWTSFSVPWFIMIISKSSNWECSTLKVVNQETFIWSWLCHWLALQQNWNYERSGISCTCVGHHRCSRSQLWLHFLLALKSCCWKHSWVDALILCLVLSQIDLLNRHTVWGCCIWNTSSSYKRLESNDVQLQYDGVLRSLVCLVISGMCV